MLAGSPPVAITLPDSDHERRRARRAQRYKRRDTVQVVTGLDRVAACGRRLTGGAAAIVRSSDGVARFTGVQTCGSIWACPVCAAKIRQHRADELHRGLIAHATRGGGAYFVTLTAGHQVTDSLRRSFTLLADSFRSIQQGRNRAFSPTGLRDPRGVIGVVRATEITYGVHGWHPHLHLLILTGSPLSDDERDRLSSSIWSAWSDQVRRRGGYVVESAYRFEEAGSAGIAEYLTKVAQHEQLDTSEREAASVAFGRTRGLAHEVARSDSKEGRGGSLTPWDLADRAYADLRDTGEVGRWWELWREYESTTRGRRAMSWSKGLRTYLAEIAEIDAEERTDAEIADESVAQEGDEVVAHLGRDAWGRVVAVPGLRVRLLDLAEHGGREAVRLQLAALGVAFERVEVT